MVISEIASRRFRANEKAARWRPFVMNLPARAIEPGQDHSCRVFPLLDLDQLDIKQQRGVAGNHAASAAGAVAQRGRDHQRAVAA